MADQQSDGREEKINAFLWGYLAGNPEREAFLRDIPSLSEKEINRLTFFLTGSGDHVQKLIQQCFSAPYEEGESITRLIEKAYTNQGIAAFLQETPQKISFLETQYGYQRLGEKLEDQDPLDKEVISLYAGPQIGVKLIWAYTWGRISVLFVELSQPGTFPRRYSLVENTNRPDMARAISLETLVEMLGHGDDPHFLLTYNKKNPKSWKIPFEHIDDVLDGLVYCIQTYASDILRGDTNLFDKVMQYYAHKMNI